MLWGWGLFVLFCLIAAGTVAIAFIYLARRLDEPVGTDPDGVCPCIGARAPLLTYADPVKRWAWQRRAGQPGSDGRAHASDTARTLWPTAKNRWHPHSSQCCGAANCRRRSPRSSCCRWTAAHDVLLEGSMDRIWNVPWIRPVLRLLARWDVLFPETGRDVPRRCISSPAAIVRAVSALLAPDLALPQVTAASNAAVDLGTERQWVAEWMGPGGCFEMAWHVAFVPPTSLEVDARLKALRLDALRLPLPTPLQVSATQSIGPTGGRRRDLLRARADQPHPWRLCGYEGTFRVKRIPVRRAVHRERRRLVDLERQRLPLTLAESRGRLQRRLGRRQRPLAQAGSEGAWSDRAGTAACLADRRHDGRRVRTRVLVGIARSSSTRPSSPSVSRKDPRPIGFVWAVKTKRLPLRFGHDPHQ